MLYEEWKSRYKNLKNFNTVLQRCPRFWPLAPPRGMNPGVYSLGISEDPPRYLSSKFDASVRSDCWDISIWKTLTQCDGNGNANANANANANEDDRGDYNSSPCTSYRRANNQGRKLQNGVRKSFLNVICLHNVLYILVKYHENILTCFKVMVRTKFLLFWRQGEVTHRPSQLELSFLYWTPYQMPSTTWQFPENSSKGS